LPKSGVGGFKSVASVVPYPPSSYAAGDTTITERWGEGDIFSQHISSVLCSGNYITVEKHWGGT